MMTLVTGLPGACKTLHTLVHVKAEADKDKRQVYYSGIKNLALDWIEHDPKKWFELPPKSIMVIDECQDLFPARPSGASLPEYISRLAKHRHGGVDLVFITQHPMMADPYIRRLSNRHLHMVRIAGLEASTVHEWASVKDNCDKNRSDSNQSKFIFPKDSYQWYHSADAHTHKVRIPKYLYVLAFCVLAFMALAYRIYSNRIASSPVAETAQSVPPKADLPSVRTASSRREGEVMTPLEYAQQFQPRVPGLAYTAAAYDVVTKPVRAPYPAACVQGKSRCQCYTQQGTKLEVPKDLCQGIVTGGFFMAWDEHKGRDMMQVNKPTPLQPAGTNEPLSGLINATPGYTPANSRPIAEQVADGQNLRHGKNNRIPG